MQHRLRSAPLAALFACSAVLITIPACSPEPAEPTITPPGWHRHMAGDPARQFELVAEVENYFYYSKGLRARLDEHGEIRLDGANATTFPLDKLAQACSRTDRAGWPMVIQNHFDELIAASEELAGLTVGPFEVARPHLRLRFQPESILDESGMTRDQIVCRTDLPGLLTCVVIDSAETALVLPRAELESWNREQAVVEGIALANTRQHLQGALEVVGREFGEFGTLRVLTGADDYAATAVLWLDDWPELRGTHGTLLTMPWRTSVITYRVDDDQAERVAYGLSEYASRLVDESSGTLSPDVFWRKTDGSFVKVSK